VEDYDAAFAAWVKLRVDAVIVQPSLATPRAIALARQHRLPALSSSQGFVEAGGLLSYVGNSRDTNRKAASYVDRVLKGAKPADLPVEQPTRFELRVNGKTAKALGLAIPQSLLIRADEVIE
jgi:putative ABC transport system substrate-binding protein